MSNTAYEEYKTKEEKKLKGECHPIYLSEPLDYRQARDKTIKLTRDTLDKSIEYGFLFDINKIDEPHINKIYKGSKTDCFIQMPIKRSGSFHTHADIPEDIPCIFSTNDIITDIGKRIVLACVRENGEDIINMDLRLIDNERGNKLYYYTQLSNKLEFKGLNQLEQSVIKEITDTYFKGDII